MDLFTIGHSTHSSERFVALLGRHRIAAVADVRRFPGSRRSPHFNGDAMAGWLEREGIHYHHIPALGGRRSQATDSPNTGWREAAFRGYADHMATAEFRQGRTEVEQLARGAGPP
jgi:uncharacterized protein (DUF488 family)